MKRESEAGLALIAVLWLLILLSILAATLSLQTRSDARVARNMIDNASAAAAADAGVQRAILDLEASLIPPTDQQKLRADGKVHAWPFADGVVYITIEDEAAKVDLNRAPEKRLAAVFASVGVDQEKAGMLADAIADFRDADHLLHPLGAEESEYRAAGLAWGPKNAPFDSVEEVQQVLGMTPEIYARVAPRLTVFGSSDSAAADSDQALMDAAAPPAGDGNVFSIRAEARTANGAQFVREAIVQLTAQSGSPFRILAWRKGAARPIIAQGAS